MTNQLARKPYPSDVTDAQWMILAPLIPEPGAWSPREPIEQREIESAHSLPVANGLLVETDAPRSARARKTVSHSFRKWKLDGTWEKAMTATRRAGANPDGAVGANPAQPSRSFWVGKPRFAPKPGNESHQKWVLVDDKPVLRILPKGGFQVQRHRWKVERTIGWLIRYRRLARDYEGLPSSNQALIQIAAIRLCLTRLTPFCSVVT